MKEQKVLIFVDDIYEDLELQYPKYRLIEGGKKVVVVDKNLISSRFPDDLPLFCSAILKQLS